MAPLDFGLGKFWRMVHPLAFLSLFSVSGAQVADFAPLEVGNTWIYQGSSSSYASGRFTWNSVRRTLKVLSTAGTGGSSVHVVSVRDSLHNRGDSSAFAPEVSNLPDSISDTVYSIIESGDTLSSGLQGFFYRHGVPDSLKNREVMTSYSAVAITERMTGPFPIEDEPRWVYQRRTHKVLGMGASSTDSSVFAQNLGAVLVGGGGGRSGFATSRGEYRLIEFNGNPVDYTQVPETSSRPKIRGIVPAAAKKSGPVVLFPGDRDGLGRLGVPPRSPGLHPPPR